MTSPGAKRRAAARSDDPGTPGDAVDVPATVPPPRTAPDRLDPGASEPAEGPDSADDGHPVAGHHSADGGHPADGPDPTGIDGADEGDGADGLTGRERDILAFEQRWWRHAGAKEQAIRDTFGLSATRYYQLLNALLDKPAALAAEPLLIGRLRRLRASRARSRRR
ncbi:DUF3263 domain-containing protein [Micromonospora echinofusca]|uniref:DUF3263 domain-containing protein n=1 Tax=Micromonospora echinofusca TaxID=47858 RepID=A0ABS3VPS3_MICEH|nr:DUF3263 domain-containing protein [Micromonospora echinofusca]MBO4206545.1 DUF3263 domain-containing protein [Micromonospora echinofusca]